MAYYWSESQTISILLKRHQKTLISKMVAESHFVHSSWENLVLPEAADGGISYNIIIAAQTHTWIIYTRRTLFMSKTQKKA